MPTESRRIGGKQDQVGTGRLHGTNDRRVVDGRRRVAAIIDDPEPELFRVLARADQNIVGEFGIGSDQRHRLGRRAQRFRDFEKRAGQDAFRIGTERGALEISGISELGIGAERQQHHDHLLALHDHGHGRDDEIGRGAHHEVDLVDVDELGVDARNGGGVALVVVIDELYRTTEQTTLGIDLFHPDLLRQEVRLAGGSKSAGQGHAESDLDRLLGEHASSRSHCKPCAGKETPR